MDLTFLREYCRSKNIQLAEQSDCRQGMRVLTRSQVAVHALASAYASPVVEYPEMHGKRGALVYHETGSGKTCCVACIIDAFWDAGDRYKQLVVVTSPSALKSNPPSNYHRCCTMLPRFPDDPKAIAKLFDKRGVTFTTFARLAHATGVHRPSKKSRGYVRTPAVYIVDEAHTVFRPLPAQRKEMAAVMEVLFGAQSQREDRYFLLTATPGESRADILRLLNILRDPQVLPPLTAPRSAEESREFARECSFMVSRFDVRHDPNVYPRVAVQDIKVSMHARQYARYREAVVSTSPTDKDYDALKREQKLQRLYASARRFSNALFQVDPDDPLASVACKLPELLRRILEYAGDKHFVYSAFGDRRGRGRLSGQGIHSVASVLESAGYQCVQQAAIEALSEDDDDVRMLRLPRYALVTPTSLAKFKDPDAALAGLLRLFNSAANVRGEYVQVLLASGGFYESMDLKAVRHVHLFDPMLSVFAQEQAIGRAARRCSHSQIDDVAERTVLVHRYFAIAPSERDVLDLIQDGEDQLQRLSGSSAATQRAYLAGLRELLGYVSRRTVDEYIDELARRKYAPIKQLLQLLEVASVDCQLFSGASCVAYARKFRV